MFTKLLKHEFRATKKALLPLTLAALLSAVLCYVIMLIAESELGITDNSLFALLSIILCGSIILFFVIYAVGSELYLFYRFYKNKFSDEGYLTFTLPATTHQILLSSILNIVIWTVITIVVTWVCFLIALAPLWTLGLDSIETTPLADIVDWNGFSYLLQAFGSFCYSIILPLLSITIGSLIAKKHKILTAFGVGYLISIAVSFVTSVLSIIELAALDSATGDVQLGSAMLFTGILMLGISVGGYFLMHYLIKKKLNI